MTKSKREFEFPFNKIKYADIIHFSRVRSMGMQNPGFSRWDRRSPPPPSPRSPRQATPSGAEGIIITHRNYSPIRHPRTSSPASPTASSTASLVASLPPPTPTPSATSSPLPAAPIPAPPQFEDAPLVPTAPPLEEEDDYRKSNVKQLERKVASSVRGIQRLKSEIWRLEKEKKREQKRKGGKEKRKVRWRSTERSDSGSCSSPSGAHFKYCDCWECKRPRY